VRVPLSWLRDFAPFDGDPAVLAATLDDLGLVVEEMEIVGEGLGGVVVARVEQITPIEGADRIRMVVVDDGSGPIEVVCGAWNFEAGDLVALAPVGAVLPGGFKIGRRKMKGVFSNGMLCSGQELNLSDDHEGILRLNDVEGAMVGQPLTVAMGIETDVVFDIAVEANRPDAWSVAGVARDLAARLGQPFAIPLTSEIGPLTSESESAVSESESAVSESESAVSESESAVSESESAVSDVTGGGVKAPTGEERTVGTPVESLATVRVDDLELCPRFTARVITGVQLSPSPRWMARRLTLAGMRPINNVVDASNYVMLELGQPTHPYDLDRLAGHGLVIRRARTGETLVTLDGIERTMGRPGPGLGDTGQDCLICDAEGVPVAIGGVMGGASSEIDVATSRVLLEAAYFDPMAIARTSKRLALRTEASSRFERGCDPAGIDRAAERFCELLALTAGHAMTVAVGAIDVRGAVPIPEELTVRPSRINALLGSELTSSGIADLLTPLGIESDLLGNSDDSPMRVTVPTYRPDIRPAPMGEADIAEEVARTYGYARITRRMPSWPQPGHLTTYQRDRRLLKDVLCGLGCHEGWTTTFVSEFDQVQAGFDPPYVEVTNPLVESERFLRSSMVPGLIRAVIYNTERRQGDVRLFEVGSVFCYPEDPPVDPEDGPPADTSERLSAIFAAEGDDAWMAVAAWRIIADALRIADWVMGDRPHFSPAAKALHVYRSASLSSIVTGPVDENGFSEHPTELGVIGELDPYLVGQFGLLNADGRPRRVGWLDLDIGTLLDRHRVPRRTEEARPITRFPSSDVDLAFVVRDPVPAGSVERLLRTTGGDLLESVDLFDVYRGPSVEEGSRSLAFRLRFCALDRTLTDEEIGQLRSTCIDAVETRYQARLR
jgi:phenylalanyl-tRNA synthetase beta chain